MKMMNKFCSLMLSAVLCAGMAAPAFAFEGEAAPVEQPVLPEVVEDIVTITDETSGALTPEGNLTLVDDYHTNYSDGSGQQFITLVSKSGNTFYLVIDRNAKGQQTVHFMNLVDEADLLALMEEDAADAYTAEKEAAAQAEQDKLKAEEEAKKAAEEAAASTIISLRKPSTKCVRAAWWRFVTSRYTLDSKDSSARKHMAERADLLGAIRLPNNAFRANAGTDVVSDIIFLQKRDRPADIEPAWVQLGKTEDGFAINQYFVDHPEMILGVLSTESTQYGREELTVAPIEGANLADQLAEAVQHIEGRYTEVEVETPDIADAENEKHILPADPDVKNFSYTVVDGEVFYRENSVMTQVELSDTAKGRVTGMVELRQIVNDLIDQQLNDYPDEDIKATQERLNAAYDAFTAKYGLLNDRKTGGCLSKIPPIICCVRWKIWTSRGSSRARRRCLRKRTIRPERTVTSVDTPQRSVGGVHRGTWQGGLALYGGAAGHSRRVWAHHRRAFRRDLQRPCRRPHRPGSRLADGRRVPVRRCPGKAADGAVCGRDQPGICCQCGCADQSAAQRTGSLRN